MENFNIIEERENPLFKRKEIKFSVDAEITPSHADARKIISEKFSTNEENIRIKNILGKFGSRTFTISTNIYTSEQDKLNTEGKSKKDGVVTPEEPAQPEQPAEAPTEAPTEPAPTPVSNASPPEPPKSEEPDNKPEESIEPKPEEKTE